VKVVAILGMLFVAGGIYLITSGTVVLGGVVLVLGIFDVVVGAGLRRRLPGLPRRGQLASYGPASHRVWRVLFVVGSFAAIGAAVGASGGVRLAVGLAVFASLIALVVSLVMVGGSRPSEDGRP
jgi:hypothetical protein